MTMLIRSHISSFPAGTQTMVLMSDLDEMPARHTVDLLKNCDFGSSIHLQLRDYLYRYVATA
jgi:beta-1,4-mannosyl-glycoprotein beta-1,4-N-acetylglucosaminyltransferase